MTTSNKKIEISKDLTRQIAVRFARGISLRQLEEEFGFTRPVLNRTLETQLAKDTITETKNDYLIAKLLETRRSISDLLPKAVAVLSDKLDKGELKAVEMVLKASTLLNPADHGNKSAQQQAITVILPGAVAPKDIKHE